VYNIYMEDAIKNFAEQFSFEPIIENLESLKRTDSFVLGGMGGSHLSAGLLKTLRPDLDIYVHRDYGLPSLANKKFKGSLYIASSYSGNTEETIDFAENAAELGYAVAVIATGGKLIDFAKKNMLAHIVLPDTGIQPRSALGFSLIALATFVDSAQGSADFALVEEIKKVGSSLQPTNFNKTGASLAEDLKGKVPIVYASRENLSLAYNWKIKCNETGKIPAFYNVIPELNHNEMTGFDVVPETKDLSSGFYFIFLTDENDSPKIQKRMEILQKLYTERGLSVTSLKLEGSTEIEKIFNSLLLADWTALSLSKIYGTEAEKVPMVEEFKKMVANG